MHDSVVTSAMPSVVPACLEPFLAHRIWDVAAQRPLRKLLGHTAEVKGVSVTQDSDACVSCSTDCTVKLWKVPFAPDEAGPLLQNDRAVFEFRGKGAFRGIDHHWGRNSFATAGPQVDIWDHERSEPVNSFTWGADSIMSVRFNPVSIWLLVCMLNMQRLLSKLPTAKQQQISSWSWNF